MRSRIASTKLVIVMVGLPARGKTHIARRVARYLNWKGVSARVFNVGSYRREHIGAHQPHTFFDPTNPEGMAARERMAVAAMEDVARWLEHDGGHVAIYDATNTTIARRRRVEAFFTARKAEVVFLESTCSDPAIIEDNIRSHKIRSPDYKGQDPDAAVADFRRRIAHYEAAYEPLDDSCRYIQTVDVGERVVINHIRGWLLGGVVNLLTCLHTQPRTVYLTRHGESRFNSAGRIGGDTPLTAEGEAYAERLTAYLRTKIDGPGVEVWTSTLERTRATARRLPWKSFPLKALDEIDAGAFDGMTYEEIAKKHPGDFAARKLGKLTYRYPQGESYIDVVNRLEPVILELERHRGPLVIVGHQAILRVLYGYLTDKPLQEIPHLSIPLHTVIELTPIAYGALEERVPLT
ncbi:MAG: histidine phosphatase family protein [Alphaproteobacteria bacterium]|nr:histidine phosphatase family protein [Alphaproteobacteria bacterium]MCB9690348.1 histidine phosphatase family protein [Alphaproteobacteria bacterium]